MYAAAQNATSAGNAPSQQAPRLLSETQENPCQYQPGQSPEMVIIQGGEFVMGSPGSEVDREDNEGPQHRAWVQPFAIGRCEITVAEFRLFVTETGYQTQAESGLGRLGGGQKDLCSLWDERTNSFRMLGDTNWLQPGIVQTEQSPVTCVSWIDARAFALWLSLRTGINYRLPTEAEWEYAARAGTSTPFSTGNCISAQQAAFDARYHYSDCPAEAEYLMKTTDAGIYPVNFFGLKDVHGNLWEWTNDCWHPSYQGAPGNGSSWEEDGAGDCTERVLRGGSWFSETRFLRSASRAPFGAGVVSITIGFRLARTLSLESLGKEKGAAAK